MNLCINCKHFRKSDINPNDNYLSRCARKSVINPIDGSQKMIFCEVERHSHGTCGPDGRHYEPSRIPDFRDDRTITHTEYLEFSPDGRQLKAGA